MDNNFDIGKFDKAFEAFCEKHGVKNGFICILNPTDDTQIFTADCTESQTDPTITLLRANVDGILVAAKQLDSLITKSAVKE